MSRPLSISSRMERRGSSTAICSTSLRFFSPPEKPSLTPRFMKAGSISTSFIFSRASPRKSTASSSSSPRALRWAFSAVRRKYMFPTPGISTGYWNPRKRPDTARSSGVSARRSLPSRVAVPPVTSARSRPASTPAKVLLPEPFGPMMACTSPGFTVRSRPLRISLSSMRALRPRTSSSAAPFGLLAHPTLPSRLMPRSFCASTANSMGSSLRTCRAKPLTIIETASSSLMPRWRQ